MITRWIIAAVIVWVFYAVVVIAAGWWIYHLWPPIVVFIKGVLVPVGCFATVVGLLVWAHGVYYDC